VLLTEFLWDVMLCNLVRFLLMFQRIMMPNTPTLLNHLATRDKGNMN